jgi:hypothetical protein
MAFERSQFPVLITDAHTTAALGALRSLAAAGFPIHVMGESADMLCFASKAPHQALVCPPYDSPDFSDWLESTIRVQGIRLILPTERFLHALGARLGDFLPFLHAKVSPETLRISLGKTALFDAFTKAADARLREGLPRHLVVSAESALPSRESFSGWPTPFFIKADTLEAKAQAPALVQSVDSIDELLRELPKILARYRRVLVQGFAPGRGVGAFLLRWNGQLIAHFMHERLHEVPHTGGHSSLRRAYWDERIFADARRRAEFLNWEGPCMFEYRQDSKGDFQLMELNPRLWGSLHLALHAGVDFPLLLADLARGAAVTTPPPYNERAVARLAVPGEIQYVRSLLKDPAVPLARKLGGIVQYFWLFLKPGVRDDLFWPRDRGVFWWALRNYAASFFKRRA